MRALISVSDKTGVVDFAKNLEALGFEIISTSGTLKVLKEGGVKVIDIKDVTGFPEICEGRVKTLHPKVHGGLLAKRDNPLHLKDLKENGIEFIDVVCVNLYPFVKTIQKEGVTMEEAIENIDIGGPSMLRSAAKNYQDVTVLCDPSDYDIVIEQIKEKQNTTIETRLKLAAKAFTYTADYDAYISTYMREKAGLTEILRLSFLRKQDLRYGENPHQKAAFYQDMHENSYSLAYSVQLQGKELSYNNIQDANAALNIVKEFKNVPFVVGLKHMNPCGAAVGTNLVDAWTKAYLADPVSIYGGIVATNQVVDKKAAKMMKYTIPTTEDETKQPLFLEVILAPKFTEEALAEFSKRKNVRLIEFRMDEFKDELQYVSVNGGLLVQDLDTKLLEVSEAMTVTDKNPSEKELADLNFAWKIVKHVKSNAIVIAKDLTTVGVGAGQMNRVGSCKIALESAYSRGYKEGLVLASDGFLPFADTVLYAATNGVTSIVQPGGSIRDEDSINACNEKGLSMLFTNMRHFKH